MSKTFRNVEARWRPKMVVSFGVTLCVYSLLGGCFLSRSTDNRADDDETVNDSGIETRTGASNDTDGEVFGSGGDRGDTNERDAGAVDTSVSETSESDSEVSSSEDSSVEASGKLPQPPIWSPINIDDPPLEEPTWRSSNKPFCADPQETIEVSSIWSDELSGVYVFFRKYTGGEVILQNDGDGWTDRYVDDSGSRGVGIRGFEGGVLLKYSYSPCAIEIIEGQGSACSAAASSVGDVFVVGPSLAYATDADRVLQYDGELWTQLGDPLEPPESLRSVHAYRVWADEETVVVASDAGLFRLSESGNGFENLESAPLQAYHSVWGFEDKLWAATRAGTLLFYDSLEWKTVFSGESSCSPRIRGIWGEGGVVYFYTDTEVGVWESDSTRILTSFSCESGIEIKGLWGNSSDEVFVLISDPASETSECGGYFTLYYDGNEFAQF